MADSALERVTEKLQKTLEAAAPLKGIPVIWGPPVGDDRPAEFVSVGFGPNGESGDAERNWGPIGAGQLEEDLTIELQVESSGHDGTDLKGAYTRSFEIAADVEAAIRADITLGDLLLLPARLSRWRGRYFRADKVRGHRVFLTLTAQARI
jgi:hypothetical protein